MRTAGLVARHRKRQLPKDGGVRPEHAIAPNVLDRNFEAPGPNQRWVADFTYIWTSQQGCLYLAVVLDLYSRYVVGWSMIAGVTADPVADALLMVIWQRGWPGDLLHHSDRGSQYTSELFQLLRSDHGVRCNMSRRGDCWDNAAMESFFFSTLKVEHVYRLNYRTHDEVKADLFEYIEGFYNTRRGILRSVKSARRSSNMDNQLNRVSTELGVAHHNIESLKQHEAERQSVA